MEFEIQKQDKLDNYSSNYSYEFSDNDFKIIFFQGGNGDLCFLIISNDVKDISITIDKENFNDLYLIFDDFYHKLDNYKNRFGYEELFQNGYFSWRSDAPANEEDWDKAGVKFIYNYLNIFKHENSYKLVFVNNINKQNFCIEFNTDRSRYGPLVFPVCELFKDLKKLETNDEYIKRLAKK